MTEKYTDDMAKLEAILYAYGRPVSLSDLVAYLKLDSEREVSELIDRIREIYQEDGSALEIKRVARGRVVLQLKPQYTQKVGRFSMKPLLTSGPLKTLSYVAYNQPIEQVDVAEARGSHAYNHLSMLEDMELITREKKGRTKVVRTTDTFADYLGLSHNKGVMKRQLSKIFKRLEVKQMDKK